MTFYSEIDHSHLQQLCPELRQMLDAELAAGNEIVETHSGWPRQSSIFVSLKRPFSVPWPNLPPGIVHRDVNDPHWWKAEYVHELTGHILVCRFGPSLQIWADLSLI